MNKDSPLPLGRKHQNGRPEWEFKFGKKSCKEGRGGIDWYLYRKNILWLKLYLFYETIARETDKKIWLIEDNASAHSKAAADQKEKRIQ